MKRDFRQMFLDVDGPLAIEMAEILSALNSASAPELHEQVGLLCHRIRGDARTVGFAVIGDLTGVIEEALPIRSVNRSIDEDGWRKLRIVANEIRRRMSAGHIACEEPLSEDLLALVERPVD